MGKAEGDQPPCFAQDGTGFSAESLPRNSENSGILSWSITLGSTSIEKHHSSFQTEGRE